MLKLFNFKANSSLPKWNFFAGYFMLCLLFYLPGDNIALARASVVAVVIESQEMVTASETGEIMVDQRLQLSRPLQELSLLDEAFPEAWLEHLGLKEVTLVSAVVDKDILHLRYKFKANGIQPYQLTLPAWSIATLIESTLLQYTLPLEINRQINIEVPGVLTHLPEPVFRQWNGHNQFVVEPKIETINRATVKQSMKINQPGLPALQAMRIGLPPLQLGYITIRPSTQAALPYRVALGVMALASLAFVTMASRSEITPFRLNFFALNILLALVGFLVGGAAIAEGLAFAFHRPLSLFITASVWPRFLENFVLGTGLGWPVLVGGGVFLWYLAFSILHRAVWTHWATLCLLMLFSLYVYGVIFLLLPWQEFIAQQRLILILSAFIFSIIISPILLTFTRPHSAYYIRD